MGIFLVNHPPSSCLLCGSIGELTGEHKVKASAIRSQFKTEKMVIGISGDAERKFRPAQGPNSKEFHFESKICKQCNNRRTQPADREFDQFHSRVETLHREKRRPEEIWAEPKYLVGSEAYLNVFRYFAKLLSCHLAEVKAPRPRRLANFALGKATHNSVWLAVGTDWTYGQYVEQLGEHQYAAHGGLVVYADKKSGHPNAFHSTLTIGPIQYVFHMRLAPLEVLELRLAHQGFMNWCLEQTTKAAETPLSREERLAPGMEHDDGNS